MVTVRIQVKTLEAHFTEHVECNVGLPGDGVSNDEGVVEADAVEVAAVGAEVVEEVEDKRGEFGAGEDAEDGGEGGAGVVEVGLVAGPVEEFEGGEDVAAVGGEVAEDAEDEGFGEGREREGGEGGGEFVAVLGGGEDLVDVVEEWVAVGGLEP